jgi:hypothetical protein
VSRRLTTNELRQLAAGRAKPDITQRAFCELRDRRAVEQLKPEQVAALESVRALVEEEGGDRTAELAVLDALLLAHGKAPPAPAEAPEPETQARPPRDVTRWPFV